LGGGLIGQQIEHTSIVDQTSTLNYYRRVGIRKGDQHPNNESYQVHGDAFERFLSYRGPTPSFSLLRPSLLPQMKRRRREEREREREVRKEISVAEQLQ